MKWYIAHLIEVVKYKNCKQNNYPCYENIFLIHAKNSEDAWVKARKIGMTRESDDSNTFKWDKKPATRVFGGIRKIIETEHPNKTPFNGEELSYSQILVKTKKELERLINGKSVSILYEE